MLNYLNLRKILIVFGIAMLFLVNKQAMAAAFGIKEQNVTHLGYAYSGTAALAEDASIGYSNPAGLINVKKPQIVCGMIGLLSRTRLEVINVNGNLVHSTVSGDKVVKPKNKGLLPNLHIVQPIGDNWAISFNVSSPFALKNIYANDSIVRYSATKSEIKTIDFGPSIAYALNDKLALGIGFDALYGEAKVFSNISVGAGEGHVDSSGSGWAYGYHFGLFYQLSDVTRIGLAYHSRFSMRASGDTHSKNTGSANPATGFSSRLDLPDRITYSIVHIYDDQWTGMADFEWVQWSRLKSIDLDFNNGTFTEEKLHYRNSYRLALGARYIVDDNWRLKCGLAYEKSPVSEHNRIARIPDSNRYWLGLGAKYVCSKNFSIDVGYAHLFFQKAKINISGPDGSASTVAVRNQSIKGTYKNTFASIVGIQLAWNFV